MRVVCLYVLACAAVAGASIQLRDVQKNESQCHAADSDGNYVFAPIQPGTYEVIVTHRGFKTITRSGLTLHVNQSATVDMHL